MSHKWKVKQKVKRKILSRHPIKTSSQCINLTQFHINFPYFIDLKSPAMVKSLESRLHYFDQKKNVCQL